MNPLLLVWTSIIAIGGVTGVFVTNFVNWDYNPVQEAKSSIVQDRMVGVSMSPTLRDDDLISYDTSKTNPVIGDVVVFTCATEKCNNDGKYGKLSRLLKINEDGCYWLESDNENHKTGSNIYGWLCPPNDIQIVGILIGLDNSKYSVKTETPEIKSEAIKPTVKKPVEKAETVAKSKNKKDISEDIVGDFELKMLMEEIKKPSKVQELPPIPKYVPPPAPKKIDSTDFNPRVCIPQNGILVCNHN